MTNSYYELEKLFNGPGKEEYLGEEVSISQHMLQTGHAARMAGAEKNLCVAAVLHDVGHLLVSPEGKEISGIELMQGNDNKHDQIAAQWLSKWFDNSITDPIKLHVAAKRYLCTVDAEYINKLSEASKFTLKVQGGLMTKDQVEAFEAEPYFKDAVELRKFDDIGKDPDAKNLALSDFKEDILSLDTSLN